MQIPISYTLCLLKLKLHCEDKIAMKVWICSWGRIDCGLLYACRLHIGDLNIRPHCCSLLVSTHMWKHCLIMGLCSIFLFQGNAHWHIIGLLSLNQCYAGMGLTHSLLLVNIMELDHLKNVQQCPPHAMCSCSFSPSRLPNSTRKSISKGLMDNGYDEINSNVSFLKIYRCLLIFNLPSICIISHITLQWQ